MAQPAIGHADGCCITHDNPFQIDISAIIELMLIISGAKLDFIAAIQSLSALAQEHRLRVFRVLVRAGPDGLSAGEIAREVGVLPNTLSTHLTILGHAGLIQSQRKGRSIIYAADYDGMRDLLGFLVADCCASRPEICAPLADLAQACCPSA